MKHLQYNSIVSVFLFGGNLVKWCELTGIIWLGLLINSILVSLNVFWGLIIIAIFFELLIISQFMHKKIPLMSSNQFGRYFIAGFVLILPLGGLGTAGYLFANLPFPEQIVRLVNLHRVVVGIPAIILYLFLWFIWLKVTKRHNDFRLKKNLTLKLISVILGCVSLLLLLLLTDFKLSFIDDQILGSMTLLIGMLLVASIMSTLLYLHFGVHYSKLSSQPNLGGWGLIIAAIATVSFGLVGLNPQTKQEPIVIAHRGVDSNNGVQNSLQSLIKTGQENKYIEMDIQMSHDNQFVLMHDPNLKKLAGKNQTVETDEFADLKKIKLHENGYVASVTTLDQYLDKANELNNQLIIELKPQAIAPQIVANKFNQQYGLKTIKSGAIVHSVDSEIVSAVKQINPNIKVGLIRPFVLSELPTKGISFYSLDYRTINQTIVTKAHDQNKKVYVWTVNSPTVARRMVALGVDGIITDQSSLIKRVLKEKTNLVVEQAKNIIWQLI